MTRITVAASAAGLLAATAVITWSRSAHVEPKSAASVAAAGAAATSAPMISPFEIMVKHGKDLPIEAWDAF